jgi:predicted RNase H-like nuclease
MIWSEVILGIDAAWTDHNPSRISLIACAYGKWSCLAADASQSEFLTRARVPSSAQPNSLSLSSIFEAAKLITGGLNPTLVAVDMPLSHELICGKRAADRLLSEEFAKNWCACHVPSKTRPGEISHKLYRDAKTCGLELRTKATYKRGEKNELLEVYPHAALLSLLSLDKRYAYKISKSRKLFKGLSLSERKNEHLAAFRVLKSALDNKIFDIPDFLPANDSAIENLASMKAYEDMLDALVCAWVGIEHLERRSDPYGDDVASIWVPSRTRQHAL